MSALANMHTFQQKINAYPWRISGSVFTKYAQPNNGCNIAIHIQNIEQSWNHPKQQQQQQQKFLIKWGRLPATILKGKKKKKNHKSVCCFHQFKILTDENFKMTNGEGLRDVQTVEIMLGGVKFKCIPTFENIL